MTPLPGKPRDPRLTRIIALLGHKKEYEDRLGAGDLSPAVVRVYRRQVAEIGRQVDALIEDFVGAAARPPAEGGAG